MWAVQIMLNPKFAHRKLEDLYHSCCLTCFRTAGTHEDELALEGLEQIHTCDARYLGIERVKDETPN